MPIGSAAQFADAAIFSPQNGGPPGSFHNDQDFFIVASASDPQTPWIDQGDWNGGDKCAITGSQATTLPFPANFTTDCNLNNNAAGVLMPDNETLVQMQPLYRGTPGSPILARYHQGCPQPFPWTVSILGDGALGAHGGSGLSAVGGTIRLGELAPTTGPISHALKLELFAHVYYYGGSAAPCYRWPAVGCDSYAHDPSSPIHYAGSNVQLKPGALLAIPPAVAPLVNVTTIPGAKIRDALAMYGGYIVDDTACNTASICMESGVNEEMEQLYNISVRINNPVSPTQGVAFYHDLVAIFSALSVVINNSNTTIGGGGTPLGPLAPPIC